MIIIPAIDIIDGKCVRLTQGDYAQKTIYNEHPLEVAKAFEDAGLQRLHLVDLDGAKAGTVKNWKVLESIASKTKLVIDFGGGIKTDKDVEIVFNSGASLATIGSIAVKNKEIFIQWLQQYGAEKFLLGADVKDEKIAVAGWLETTDVWIYDFIESYMQQGVTQLF
ncbi:MAG: HisA/HisF-related TIM barrel protein, partial [Chitinophagaceae bacterium]